MKFTAESDTLRCERGVSGTFCSSSVYQMAVNVALKLESPFVLRKYCCSN